MFEILYKALVILGVITLLVLAFLVVTLVERREKDRSDADAERHPDADAEKKRQEVQ
jgi:heme/copper-type cytochrome/quinol oxidase subunit 2